MSLSVQYERDVARAAEALLATLHPAPTPDAQAPSSERRENPDCTDSIAEQPTAA